MYVIDSLNETRFTLNGAEYLKNYVSAVRGNKVEIFNCYESRDILVPLSRPLEMMVNGSVYEDAEQLQAVLQDVLFSRTNMGVGGFSDQNNRGRIIPVGRVSDTSVSGIAEKANQFRITILETESPVIVTALTPGRRSYQKYFYLFLGGKGKWGIEGSPVQTQHLVFLTSEHVTPLLLHTEDNVLIHDLGAVRETDFLSTLRQSTWEFTDPFATYYFRTTDRDISFYKIFTGPLGIYEGKENVLEEAYFEAATDDTVQAGGGTSVDLQGVLEAGSHANVRHGISFQTNPSEGVGGTLVLQDGAFYVGNSGSVKFNTAGEFAASSNNISLNTTNELKILAGQGFHLEGNAGGSIRTDNTKGIILSGHSGGITLEGNTAGVAIDGQGGPVNVTAGPGIHVASGNGITLDGTVTLPLSGYNEPVVFGVDKATDPILFRDTDGKAIRIANGVLRVGGSSFDTNTRIASNLTVGATLESYEIRGYILRGMNSNELPSEINKIYIDGPQHDMTLDAEGDITIGGRSGNKVLKVFRDINVFGNGGYAFSISANGPMFNGERMLVNNRALAGHAAVISEKTLNLTGKEGIQLDGGTKGIALAGSTYYERDQSASFTARSLVDKDYVDRKTCGIQSVKGELVDNSDPLHPLIRIPSLDEVLSVDNTTDTVIRIGGIHLYDEIADDYKAIQIKDGKFSLQGAFKEQYIVNTLEFAGNLQNFIFPDTGGQLATQEWCKATMTTVPAASPSVSGTVKLYDRLGTNTDGPLDQATATNQLTLKAPLATPVFTGPVTISSGGLSITGGGTSTYLRGDGTAASFVNAVRAATITGGSSSVALIASGTTIDNAIWQLQNQVKAAAAFTTKSANYTATATDSTIACNGSIVVTLPVTGILAGKRYVVKNTGTGSITLTVSGGATIDGSASHSLSAQWSCVELTFDGFNYLITSSV